MIPFSRRRYYNQRTCAILAFIVVDIDHKEFQNIDQIQPLKTQSNKDLNENDLYLLENWFNNDI